MPAPRDAARFLTGDPDEVVAAAFACPVCLRTAGTVEVRDADEDIGAVAACACGGCGEAWEVTLDPWQALRLELAPPRRVS